MPLASAGFYLAGMALNDYADRELDAVERPERPIPSGRVQPRAALGLAAGLTGAGLGIAGWAGGAPALRIAVPLAAVVWAYDLAAKQTRAGPAAMAAARGLDVLLGAGGRLRRAVLPALTVAGHTAKVTVLSRGEVHGASRVSGGTALAAAYACTVGRAQAAAVHRPDAMTVRSATGAGVRGEIPLQTALVAGNGARGGDRIDQLRTADPAGFEEGVTDMSVRFGYGTNGFAGHRLDEALTVIAGLGYSGVALTVDHPHLDPFAPDLAARTDAVRRRLDALGLAVVVETGARYVLDPWRKHEPTLVSADGRERRVDYLCRAVRIAADLGAEAVSFWSGTLPPGTPSEQGWQRLIAGVEPVLTEADRRGVICAFEPEPGMFVDTLARVTELRQRLGEPERLRITVDIGHCVCNEPASVGACIRAVGPLLANVQLDDMCRGVHEHLEFGHGEIDLPAALGALLDAEYSGLAAVELPRHSHAAPTVAARSLDVLRGALAEAERARAKTRESV